jgi:hypothetical protein
MIEYLISTAVFNVYLLFSASASFYFRKDLLLNKRRPMIQVLFAVLIGIFINSMLPQYFDVEHIVFSWMPCQAAYCINYICVTFYLNLSTLRLCDFVITYRFAQLNKSATEVTTTNALERPFFRIAMYFLDYSDKNARIYNNGGTFQTQQSASTSSQINNVFEKRFPMLRIRFTENVMFRNALICFFSCFTFGVACVMGITSSIACNLKNLSTIQLPLYVTVVMFILVSPYLLYIIRNCDDALGVRLEYIFHIGLTLLNFVVFTLTGSVGVLIILIVVSYSISVWWPIFLTWRTKTKNQVTEIEYNEESFLKTLKTPELYAKLKTEVARELSSENLLYYETIKGIFSNWCIPLTMGNHTLESSPSVSTLTKKADPTPAQKKEVMKLLYSRFLRPGAELELNVSTALRSRFLEACQLENPDLNAAVAVNDEVLRSIYCNAFFRVIRAQKGI